TITIDKKKSIGIPKKRTPGSYGGDFFKIDSEANSFIVYHKILPPDLVRRVNYCQWFLHNMNDDILEVTFSIDETWFHLEGYVNSQNIRIWSVEYPHMYIEAPLHPL
ncbi:hypothetical protein BDFB_012380, partial [Asbolus verrucosus]